MKRRRIFSDSEEEEEEDRGRRNSLRKGKRITYYTFDEDEDESSEEEEEEEDQEHSEQLGPSTKLQHHNQGPQELPVTCGVKKGHLDVEKLAKGGDCILCEGHWFSPPAFETFAGKKQSRKWKSSIFYKGEPLQKLFDNGMLTTKSYKRRNSATTKPQKILSSDVESEISSEASETDSGQTEKDDLHDNDWLPEKGEEEKQGAESGGEDHMTEEEEDKIDEGKMEDESVPAVTDEDDNNVCEDMETDLISSTCGTMAARVLLKRLEEEETECQSSCPEPEQPEEESWCKPLDDETQNEEESEHNGSATDDLYVRAGTQTDTSWMSAVKTERDKSGERKDGQTEIQTKTRKPARPLSAPATSSKPEDTQSISPVSETSPSLAKDMKDNCEEREDGKKDKVLQKNEHLETSVQPPAAQSINDSLSENKCTEPMSHSPKPLSEQADNPTDTDATTNDHEAAQIQMMNQETRNPQPTRSSDMEEVSSSRCSAGINLDTMDLDQLKKEKIKMQIKVLKLQEQYYTMKVQGFRK
ncbi:hypothetical protein INR49_029242 [Caranx melampygus]|nr:hypothetical protein INR49_029242 [Caranx melampygus]